MIEFLASLDLSDWTAFATAGLIAYAVVTERG